jgi:hypothetical protein
MTIKNPSCSCSLFFRVWGLGLRIWGYGLGIWFRDYPGELNSPGYLGEKAFIIVLEMAWVRRNSESSLMNSIISNHRCLLTGKSDGGTEQGKSTAELWG